MRTLNISMKVNLMHPVKVSSFVSSISCDLLMTSEAESFDLTTSWEYYKTCVLSSDVDILIC